MRRTASNDSLKGSNSLLSLDPFATLTSTSPLSAARPSQPPLSQRGSSTTNAAAHDPFAALDDFSTFAPASRPALGGSNPSQGASMGADLLGGMDALMSVGGGGAAHEMDPFAGMETTLVAPLAATATSTPPRDDDPFDLLDLGGAPEATAASLAGSVEGLESFFAASPSGGGGGDVRGSVGGSVGGESLDDGGLDSFLNPGGVSRGGGSGVGAHAAAVQPPSTSIEDMFTVAPGAGGVDDLFGPAPSDAEAAGGGRTVRVDALSHLMGGGAVAGTTTTGWGAAPQVRSSKKKRNDSTLFPGNVNERSRRVCGRVLVEHSEGLGECKHACEHLQRRPTAR
jgi:hypothetical protein